MTERLVDRYEGLICDLDGVVYRGPDAVPHAVEVLNGLDQRVIYATNNASRTPEDVAAHLGDLGVRLGVDDVITSSTAAATVLAAELEPATDVLAVGGEGVGAALAGVGLSPVTPAEAAAGRSVAAVLQGYGPGVCATDLAEAAYAIQAGARWVATNADLTLPTERGEAPGNGSLVAAVRAAAGTDPEVIGKPEPPMYRIAAKRLGLDPARVLAVGDRLETDLAGAVATGTGGVLVLTGVHGWADAAAAPASMRPDHVVEDLRGLLDPYPDSTRDGDRWVRGAASARVVEGRLDCSGEGVDVLRAALDALWAASDDGALDPGRCREEIARVEGNAG